MPSRFTDHKIFKEFRFTIGFDEDGKVPFLSIPVANSMVDYEEYYRITEDQFAKFRDDGKSGQEFAENCRKHLNDDLIILSPGSDRGTAV